ncbi:hypothetical protein BC2230_120197 [Burkholderia cepacia]
MPNDDEQTFRYATNALYRWAEHTGERRRLEPCDRRQSAVQFTVTSAAPNNCAIFLTRKATATED